MGRPRKSEAAKAVRGVVQATAATVVAERGRPAPPKRVSDDPVALQMWDWVADQCEAMGVLTFADRLALELIAINYSVLVEAQDKYRDEGETMYGDNGGAYVHPAVGVANAAEGRVKALMTDLGLTPRAREQLNVQLAAIKQTGKESLADYNARNPARNG